MIDPRIVISEIEKFESSSFFKVLEKHYNDQIEFHMNLLEEGIDETDNKLRYFQGMLAGIRASRRYPDIIKKIKSDELG